MPGPTPDPEGFVSLWPTLLLQRRLPGHEAANRELRRLIEARAAAKADLTTDYLAGNLLGDANPAVAWLRDCINRTVIDYLRRLGMDYAVRWHLQGWANVNRTGDYHDPHNHPHAYLSGTYYVAVPARPATPDNRPDVRPGCISFYDPRGAANMTAIRGDPQIEAEFTVEPTPGLLLLWPAFLLHFVHPNLAREARISVSYNVVLKAPGDHLPRQG